MNVRFWEKVTSIPRDAYMIMEWNKTRQQWDVVSPANEELESVEQAFRKMVKEKGIVPYDENPTLQLVQQRRSQTWFGLGRIIKHSLKRNKVLYDNRERKPELNFFDIQYPHVPVG
jgi:hypothetical protein